MARIGSMRCPVAALSRELQLVPAVCDVTDAAVTESTGGQLGYRCHKCGASGWLTKGSRSYKRRADLFTADDAPAAAAPAAAAAPVPTPVAQAVKQVTAPPAKPRPAFEFGKL